MIAITDLTGLSIPAMAGAALLILALLALVLRSRRGAGPLSPRSMSSSTLPYRQSDRISNVVGAFESETAAMIDRTSPTSEHLILYVLVAMVLLAGWLTSVVKLDRVVTGTGQVAPIGGNLFLSPLDRSLVKEVLVKPGDIVKKGQVLAVLDSTFSGADLTSMQQRLASDKAEMERYQAEISDKPYVPSTKDSYSLLQQGIWQQRQAEYKSSLSDFDSRMSAARSSFEQAQHDTSDYKKRFDLAARNEQTNVDLLKKGYVTQQTAMAAIDQRVEIGRLLNVAKSQIETGQHTLEGLQAQRQGYVQKWHSDAGAQMVTVKNDLDKTTEDLRKAQKMSDLEQLEAPADAVVLQVGNISTGSVATGSGAQSQEALFTLVPLTAQMEVELRIPAEDIGFIEPGDTVRIKLDAYNFLRHGTALGEIKTISEGSFTTNESNNTAVPPYFKAHVGLKEVSLHNVPGNFRLIPGMTLEADILVGRRTILSYLVEGALRTGSEAMREPN